MLKSGSRDVRPPPPPPLGRDGGMSIFDLPSRKPNNFKTVYIGPLPSERAKLLLGLVKIRVGSAPFGRSRQNICPSVKC